MRHRDEIDDSLLTRFSEVTLRELHPELRCALDPAEVAASIEAQLRVELGRCSDPDFAKRFCDGCPLPGRVPDDYRQRVLETPTGHRILAGIRFFGGDTDRPFVDLLASTGSLADAVELTQAIETCLEAFQPFAPRTVRCLRSTHLIISDTAGLTVERDQSIWWGQVAAMGTTAPRPGQEVTLVDVETPAEAAAFVADAYAEYWDEYPHMRDRLHAADESELEACQQDGRLAFIVVGAQRAGLIATQRTTIHGFCGDWMIEEIIVRPHRGRGLAATAQRQLAASIPSTSGKRSLWGTIDDSNIASQKTAQRAGRRAVAEFVFLTPRGGDVGRTTSS